MQILAHTYHVASGVPPRRYAVTFDIGGERQVSVACDGGRPRVLQFRGRGYRPGSHEHLKAVVDQFLLLETTARRTDVAVQRDCALGGTSHGGIDRVNDELLHAQQSPASSRAAECACGDRQLPTGDRA
jgi:hypothetical protein